MINMKMLLYSVTIASVIVNSSYIPFVIIMYTTPTLTRQSKAIIDKT